MTAIDLHLYRLKLVPPRQGLLFPDDLSRPDIFRRVLEERPSVELIPGYFWHIGNVLFIDDTGGYFAAGRTTKSTLQKYDGETGNFVEEELETSPYTHVLFDCGIGFMAIAKKTKLSPTAQGVARKIEKLFESTAVIKEHQIAVSVDAISDPVNFIQSVRAAYSIRRFEVTFSRSNPFDADEFFQKPMEKYLDATNGKSGKTVVCGDDLDAGTLVSVTKSVAATGNDAKAVLKTDERAGYSTKSLHGNPAHFLIPEEEFGGEPALQESREVYHRIRAKDDVLDHD